MTEKSSKPFSVTLEPCPEAPALALLSCGGFLDTNTVDEFDRVTAEAIASGQVRIIFDTSALSYISSAGMGSLMRLSQSLKSADGDLVLLAPPERIYAILDLLDFTKILKIRNTRAEAIALLENP